MPIRFAEPPPDSGHTLPSLTYQIPVGWTEEEPSEARVASFTVAADDGQIAYLAIIPLEGSGGTLLANINQWRSTLELENVTAEELDGLVEEIEVHGRAFKLIDFVSETPILSNPWKSRLVVAFAQVNNHRWFFKFGGDSPLVAVQKPVLLEFLNSVAFGER